MRTSKKLTIKLPATLSNIGPGFDCIGIAINIFNYISVTPARRFSLKLYGEGRSHLNKSSQNLFLKVLFKITKMYKHELIPVAIVQNNNIPIKRGLGSSATAVIAGVITANTLYNLKMSSEDILKTALMFESHPDNLTASLFGGINISSISNSDILHQKISVKIDKFPDLVLFIPEKKISTARARKVLPSHIPFKDAVSNICNTALLVNVFHKPNLFHNRKFRLVFRDRLHQPYRNKLFPEIFRVIDSAYTAGALGVFLSGSGSTICAFVPRNKKKRIAEKMRNSYDKLCYIKFARVYNKGATIIYE